MENQKFNKSIRNNLLITFILLSSFLGIFINSVTQHSFRALLTSKGIPAATIKDILRHVTLLGTSTTLLCIIIFIIVAVLLTQPLATSLKKMTKAILEIDKGNLNTRVEGNRDDELGVMAQSFNRMASSLQNTTVSKNYLNNIIKSMMEMLIVLNPDGTIKSVNEATLNILKYEESDLVGKSFNIFFEQSESEKERNFIDLLIERGVLEHIEKKFMKKNGLRIPTVISGAVMYDDLNNIEGVVCIARDISEQKDILQNLKKSEEKFRTLFDNMQTGFSLHEIVHNELGDPVDYIFLEINAAFEKQMGFYRSNVIGKKVTDVLPGIEKDQINWIKKYGKVVDTGKSIVFESYSEALGKWYSIFAYKSAENQFATMFMDITDRVKSEKEKAEMQLKMFQSYKLASIGELAAGVGHEINNPLAVLAGNIEIQKDNLIENNIDKELWLKLFTKQEDAIKRIVEIVGGLRTYSRTDSDIIETIDINKIIYNALSFLKIIYEKEGVIIEKVLHPSKLYIDGNLGKMQQVLVNLLSNAKDASEEKSERKIIIETQRKGKMAILKISDNGKGIKKDDIDKIFQQFFTTKRIGKGTGLGMAIVQNIISHINGTIEVDSTIDVGTTITVTIPMSKPSTKKEKKMTSIKFSKLEGRCIVIDDEEDIREILNIYLVGFGLEVDMAKNGKEALEKIKEVNYNYIISDITMPVMGGKELYEKIQKLGSFTGKFFFITGNVDQDFNRLEVDGTLTKPFVKEDIYTMLTS